MAVFKGRGLFWAWPGQAKPIWGFLDFNVHQPSTGHNFYFGPDFSGFHILGGNGGHGRVRASPNWKYMGVKKLCFLDPPDMAAMIHIYI